MGNNHTGNSHMGNSLFNNNLIPNKGMDSSLLDNHLWDNSLNMVCNQAMFSLVSNFHQPVNHVVSLNLQVLALHHAHLHLSHVQLPHLALHNHAVDQQHLSFHSYPLLHVPYNQRNQPKRKKGKREREARRRKKMKRGNHRLVPLTGHHTAHYHCRHMDGTVSNPLAGSHPMDNCLPMDSSLLIMGNSHPICNSRNMASSHNTGSQHMGNSMANNPHHFNHHYLPNLSQLLSRYSQYNQRCNLSRSLLVPRKLLLLNHRLPLLERSHLQLLHPLRVVNQLLLTQCLLPQHPVLRSLKQTLPKLAKHT